MHNITNRHSLSNYFGILCLIGSIFFLLWADHAYAKKIRKYPKGCESVGFQFINGKLELTPVFSDPMQPQTVYLINNKSNKNISLRYEKPPHVPYKTSFTTNLKFYRWVSLAVNERKMFFNCNAIKQSRARTPVDCANVLDICQYPRAKFPYTAFGTYWIVSNTSRWNAIHQTIKSGILLRW